VGSAEAGVTVLSVLRLHARDGVDLAAAFVELDVFGHSRRSGGFLDGRLLRPVEGGGYLVLAEWEDAEAYRAWLDHPTRAELGAQLEPVLTEDVASGELFEEV
jgi:heme-degrading monooxygenase HmoA